MTTSASSHGPSNAGLYLRELLRTKYQHVWRSRRQVARDRDVHHKSVARVLAAHLQVYPRDDHPDDRIIGAHQLESLVSRALNGQTLSLETLEVFIAAFNMDEADGETLRALWQGLQPGRVVIGNLAPLKDAPPRRHSTTQLYEFHYLGPDGQPARHSTVQTIRSLVNGLVVHRYTFKASGVTVERVLGGKPGQSYQFNEQLLAVDIALPRTLNRNDVHSLVYDTLFHEKDDPPYFNRAAHQPVTNFAIRVEFHSAKLPKQVWWAEWADYREPNTQILHAEPVELDAENAVYRHLEYVDRAVVGFIWEF